MELIDRKAAIDALRLAYWDDNIQSAKGDPCIVDALTDWAIRQIKALPSAEPTQTNKSNALKSLDCISRQAAIEALKPCAGVGNRALDKLRALPSAEPRWIPCSERLPEEDEIVLVTAYLYGEPIVLRAYLEGEEWCGEEAVYWSRESIRAWMPLPKPYEERKETDGTD